MNHIIAYPPCAGGNHLKNIITLSGKFDNQWPWEWVREQTIGLDVYFNQKQSMRGEVQSLPGRNIHEVFIDHMLQNPNGNFLIHGHFGELALYQHQIHQMQYKKALIITIDQEQERDWLIKRQNRLAQNNHPYWVNEEQIYLYRTEMYTSYFGINESLIKTIKLEKLISETLDTEFFDGLDNFFNVKIDRSKAQDIHKIWHDLNR